VSELCPESRAPHVLDGGGQAQDTFFQAPADHGWLLTLQTRDGHPNSRVRLDLTGTDGGGHGGISTRVAGVDLVPERGTRVFWPFPMALVGWRNDGAPGEPATVQASGLPLPLGTGRGDLGRYLYGSGDYQNVSAGVQTTYAVPPGATHYRIAWLADPNPGFFVRELETGGAVTAFWRTGNTDRLQTRLWTPLDSNQNPAGGALVSLELGAGGPVGAAIQWQFDLWQGMA